MSQNNKLIYFQANILDLLSSCLMERTLSYIQYHFLNDIKTNGYFLCNCIHINLCCNKLHLTVEINFLQLIETVYVWVLSTFSINIKIYEYRSWGIFVIARYGK